MDGIRWLRVPPRCAIGRTDKSARGNTFGAIQRSNPGHRIRFLKDRHQWLGREFRCSLS